LLYTIIFFIFVIDNGLIIWYIVDIEYWRIRKCLITVKNVKNVVKILVVMILIVVVLNQQRRIEP